MSEAARLIELLESNFVEMVPVRTLWKYKEFNRGLKPRNGQESYDKLKADIQANGIKASLVLLYYVGNQALILGEGNHRLSIARDLGLKEVPTEVIRYNGVGSHAFKASNPPTPIDGYVPGNLRPSQVLSKEDMTV